jgi:23S rRNA (guanosine2251-2'-O)-methyltransferase
MATGGKKPAWVVDKERGERREARETVWLFGLHAVRDALVNPAREKLRLVLTKNALDKLEEAVAASGMAPEVVEPRNFRVPIDEGSVHQGAAVEVKALNWGKFADVCAAGEGLPLVVLLDRVTDPHNVGAILRSAEVFGARAVIAPKHHSAPETGALAKTASGALERQPYLKVTNLSEAMETLKDMGFTLIGLDGEAPVALADAVAGVNGRPVALVLGAEGPGLREKTRETCDVLARIPFTGAFGSLNVSNAAAVSLYAASAALAR